MTKEVKIYTGVMKISLMSSFGKTGQIYVKKMKLDYSILPYKNILKMR